MFFWLYPKSERVDLSVQPHLVYCFLFKFFAQNAKSHFSRFANAHTSGKKAERVFRLNDFLHTNGTAMREQREEEEEVEKAREREKKNKRKRINFNLLRNGCFELKYEPGL